MPHPDWLQRAIDRNPRTAKARPLKVTRPEIEAEMWLVLDRMPRLGEEEILTAVRTARRRGVAGMGMIDSRQDRLIRESPAPVPGFCRDHPAGAYGGAHG
jgi:hypothetical protein